MFVLFYILSTLILHSVVLILSSVVLQIRGVEVVQHGYTIGTPWDIIKTPLYTIGSIIAPECTMANSTN
jgi:hypothetical protein